MEKNNQPPPKKLYTKSVAQNRRAGFDYYIEETVEAGLELHGSEVKSLRSQQVNFADSYARIVNDECWLIGLQITHYEKSHVEIPDPTRKRRLLLAKRQIEKLRRMTEIAGRTLIPLEIYFKGRWAKLKLGVGRGKKHADRRETLKTRDAKREIDRALKARRK